MDIFSHYEVL